MIHSLKQIRLEQYERFIFAFFSASLYTSKAGLYLAACLTLILLIIRAITSVNFRAWVYNHSISKLSLTLFTIGIITSFLSPGGVEGALLFFRKASILLLLPLLIYHFKIVDNRKQALKWLLIGATISVLFSFYKLFQLNGWSGQRVSSFWDIGRWGELLTYLIFLVLFLLTQSKLTTKHKVTLSILIILSCLSLIFNGSRAPIVALIILTPLYCMLFNRKLLIYGASTILVAVIAISLISPKSVDIFTQRVASITNLNNNDSNNARISMWRHALLFQQQLVKEQPSLLVTGLGLNNIQHEFTSYLTSHDMAKKLMRETNNQFSFKDHHNATLTLISSNGLVYTLLFLLLILKISSDLYQTKRSPLSNYGLFLIAAFLIMSMFYTNFIELQTMVVMFLLSICLGECDSNNETKELEERSLS
ncbi:MAG: O-antigen ligase family protein [Aliivibrio sp.]|uniref:O-antigen ligase family protein n=1 Tax=Aliivibrio sp. TaxID=1872443 RepID=UPI001A402094|nr:O-antigen ligase family protein [Aliivibrio sp.]